MPLPAISYTPSQSNARSSITDTSDDSEDGMDGILSMLRNPKTPTSSESNGNFAARTNRLSNNDSSSSTKQTSNSASSRRVKFDPAFDKDTPSQRISSKSVEVNAFPRGSGSRQINHSQPDHEPISTIRSNGNRLAGHNTIHNDRDTSTDLRATPTNLNLATNQKAGQSRWESPAPSEESNRSTPVIKNRQDECHPTESYNAMIQKIAESHQGLQEMCMGIKELQTAVAASTTREESASTSVKCLIQGVSASQQQLGELTAHLSSMMEELKKSNIGEKENLIELQLCAENERKALMEQLGNDKSKLEARWDSLAKGLESLRKEREDLEKEKNAVFVEKEKLLKEQIRLEKEEALFEQRKIAAKDDLKYAESRIEAMHQMEAKLQSEMDKLLDLSEFVSRKDAEANEKFAEAASLYEKAQELESVLMMDATVIEKQKCQLERDRQLIVQERVAVLKERSANRDIMVTGSREGGLGRSKNLTDSSDIVLKQRLASIKSQLNRLRD